MFLLVRSFKEKQFYLLNIVVLEFQINKCKFTNKNITIFTVFYKEFEQHIKIILHSSNKKAVKCVNQCLLRPLYNPYFFVPPRIVNMLFLFVLYFLFV